jgi:hypothetical protein
MINLDKCCILLNFSQMHFYTFTEKLFFIRFILEFYRFQQGISLAPANRFRNT